MIRSAIGAVIALAVVIALFVFVLVPVGRWTWDRTVASGDHTTQKVASALQDSKGADSINTVFKLQDKGVNQDLARAIAAARANGMSDDQIVAKLYAANSNDSSKLIAALGTPVAIAPVVPGNITEEQVRRIVGEEISKANAANPAVTQAQLKAMIDKAVADTMAQITKTGNLTENQIRTLVSSMLKNGSAASQPTTANFPPVLHHDGDCAPELGQIGGCSLDIGVHDDQVGLAFGVTVDWPKGGKSDAAGRCDLVLLTPGWYEDLHLNDGRFEVYTIGSDRAGWIKNLGEHRAKEQQGDYACPAKSFGDIPQWTSSAKSPPPGVNFQGPTSTGIPQGSQQAPSAQAPSSGGQQAQPQPAAPTTNCADPETVNCKQRRGSGTFSAGEAVYGYAINLANGATHSQCWIENAPSNGEVTDGVVNPWKTEVASARRCY